MMEWLVNNEVKLSRKEADAKFDVFAWCV